MLLTLRTTHVPATDLGFLLHEHPDRVQTFELPFGAAHVFYPEATESACTAALLLDGCERRPELAASPLPLEARIAALPCRGGEGLLRRLFEPLGYTVPTDPHPLDPAFPAWGSSRYFTGTATSAGTCCATSGASSGAPCAASRRRGSATSGSCAPPRRSRRSRSSAAPCGPTGGPIAAPSI